MAKKKVRVQSKRFFIDLLITSILSTILLAFLFEENLSFANLFISTVFIGIPNFLLLLMFAKINLFAKYYEKYRFYVLALIIYYVSGLMISIFAFSIGGLNGIPIWAQILIIPFYALISPIMMVVA